MSDLTVRLTDAERDAYIAKHFEKRNYTNSSETVWAENVCDPATPLIGSDLLESVRLMTDKVSRSIMCHICGYYTEEGNKIKLHYTDFYMAILEAKNEVIDDTDPHPTMRKIETQMNAAISNKENWQSANTSVSFNEEENVSVVRLYGNKIAEVGDTFIRLFDGGHQTKTTKSRLNAILAEHGESNDRVFQKSFDWFVTMNTAQGPSTVPFFSSMRLG